MFKTPFLVLMLVGAFLLSDAFGASVGSIRRAITEYIPIERAAKQAYRSISDVVEPARIEFSVNKTTESVKSVVGSGLEATVASEVLNQVDRSMDVSLAVEPSVAGATVRVMNIKEKYYPGIELTPGKYDIEVAKEGYRTRRFWVDLSENSEGRGVELAVELKSLGLPNCENVLELSNYGTMFSSAGMILQGSATYHDVDINDLYLSFSENITDANYLYVFDKVVHPDYVEFRIFQSTTVSRRDIEENRAIPINPERFVLIKAFFEKVESGVRMTYQGFTPQGAAVTEFTKKWSCEHVFNI